MKKNSEKTYILHFPHTYTHLVNMNFTLCKRWTHTHMHTRPWRFYRVICIHFDDTQKFFIHIYEPPETFLTDSFPPLHVPLILYQSRTWPPHSRHGRKLVSIEWSPPTVTGITFIVAAIVVVIPFTRHSYTDVCTCTYFKTGARVFDEFFFWKVTVSNHSKRYATKIDEKFRVVQICWTRSMNMIVAVQKFV